ncbi:sensor domain-containing diguanylate cyclase [Paenibacillus radicis (ex Xue et al. 2023)]|uniref:Sensor domain-containing diguanylate cyclase n=1 Tax=Paenibacillus radicis (ex Xue et al. 2023) TaxID=2972489 RepID=A0ABT1Y8Y6_9BACL|nr:sensor domain-containing diguanylate cyclase [Paenibacillus radicis (ex Xue et al. 2023)]MCR8629641.1 sensor domain-containing diguanylate cyclase [Paenibacillus radicis (ex Xue et al. 2023)]
MDNNNTVQDMFFRQLIDHSEDFILAMGLDGLITYSSPSFQKMLGLPSEELIERHGSSHVFEQDRERFLQSISQLIEDHKPFTLEYRYQLNDGTLLWVEGKACLIKDGGVPTGIGIISRDISPYKSVEEHLVRMAYYDALTGLPNRRLFHDRYNQSLLLAKRYQRKLAVFYLDLDDFKAINDNYGHAVGDELLQKVAARLLHCVRDPDTVSRLGGDEFVILLQQFEMPEDIDKVAHRVIQALSNRFVIGQHEISITCSMGAALYPQDGSGEDLIQSADNAMYQAKKHGKHYSEF